jgi:outer membrane protein assembly factor BamB
MERTGKIAWKSETGVGGYAHPVLVDVDKTPVLIVFGGEALFGLNPQDGKTIWKQVWTTSYKVNAATPLFHDNKLFITTGYGHGCGVFTLTATGASEDWKGKEIASKYQPCILDDGKLYGSSGGVLKCLVWPTKKVLWSSREGDLGDGGSFIKNGDFLITMSEQGKLSLLHLDTAGPKTVSQVKLFDFDNVWSSPVIYHGKLYVKGKDELVCLDIGAK